MHISPSYPNHAQTQTSLEEKLAIKAQQQELVAYENCNDSLPILFGILDNRNGTKLEVKNGSRHRVSRTLQQSIQLLPCAEAQVDASIELKYRQLFKHDVLDYTNFHATPTKYSTVS